MPHIPGAFLIPYFLTALFCGIPLVFTETLIGQLTRRSAIKCFNFSPLMVWADAGSQIFYSYAVTCGALIALGTHNKLTHNCFLYF
ncbi:sodium- and chloride-dependent glycine transporter 1-like [Octopus sinensis]|uniref:Sodium- and chloride-dependent glycine transporter 1-like n=1 Tax=Octopus sinensis TaxID=2607531 RepID=A0A7E6EI83_9MOLL|nr:sodium- and chloride-dependent glycine transporter 1-like [Octopus sinensis]